MGVKAGANNAQMGYDHAVAIRTEDKEQERSRGKVYGDESRTRNCHCVDLNPSSPAWWGLLRLRLEGHCLKLQTKTSLGVPRGRDRKAFCEAAEDAVLSKAPTRVVERVEC